MLIDDCVAATRSTANVKSSGWLVSVIGVARGGKFRRGGSRHSVPGRAGVVSGPVRASAVTSPAQSVVLDRGYRGCARCATKINKARQCLRHGTARTDRMR